MDKRGVGERWGGVLLLLYSGAVYVPSERWGKTKARIHVDDAN